MTHTATHISPHIQAAKRLLWCLVLAIGSVGLLPAQDIHFSQFFTNPLIMSPATTGYFNGNYRIGFNYKYQWPALIQQNAFNYHTQSPFIDFAFGEKALKMGWFGAGVHFLNDVAGDGSLSYKRIGGSFAYHQAFDKKQRYVMSAGFGINYILRSVDFNKFYFNNQWVEDAGFDRGINPNEPINRENFSMIDMSLGLNFGFRVHKQVLLNGGLSVLHINRPRHSFYNSSEKLGLRYTTQLNVDYDINLNYSISFNGYYSYQNAASEGVVGVMGSIRPNPKRNNKVGSSIYAGLYYRVKDALAPTIGYGYNQTRLLVNYDVTFSSLARPAKVNGGLEISLVHVGSFPNHKKNRVACPTF